MNNHKKDYSGDYTPLWSTYPHLSKKSYNMSNGKGGNFRLREFFIAVFLFMLLVSIGIMVVKNSGDKKKPVNSDNAAVAMEMFQNMGYNPKAVNVVEVKDGVYCGELINESNSVWFRIGEQGLNIFQNGNVYFSTSSNKISSVLEDIDLFTFQQYCTLRVERNQYNAAYENPAIPETAEEDDDT